jgi:flagellar hook-associated protein 1 FlgK
MDNEAGASSLGTSLTDFFNSWEQLSLNPESRAQRQTLVDNTQNLASRLNTINSDLQQQTRNLDGNITSTVKDINQACRNIADLNNKIIAGEAGGKTANDFRDERQTQIDSLAANLNISWFEDANGAVSVYTGQGALLVQGDYPGANSPDPLTFKDVSGYSDKQVVSFTSDQVMDSSQISSGKMGAWLQTRDGDLKGMQDFVDGLSKNLIWAVNQQHSQGSGQTMFTDVTGSYKSVDYQTALNASTNTLPFKDQIKAGSFQIWVDQAGTRRSYTVDVDPSDNITAIAKKINDVINPTQNASQNPVATVENGQQLRFHSSNGIQFSFANDTSGLLAGMGINTFMDGYSAGTIGVNSLVQADVGRIAVGRLTDAGE